MYPQTLLPANVVMAMLAVELMAGRERGAGLIGSGVRCERRQLPRQTLMAGGVFGLLADGGFAGMI